MILFNYFSACDNSRSASDPYPTASGSSGPTASAPKLDPDSGADVGGPRNVQDCKQGHEARKGSHLRIHGRLQGQSLPTFR